MKNIQTMGIDSQEILRTPVFFFFSLTCFCTRKMIKVRFPHLKYMGINTLLRARLNDVKNFFFTVQLFKSKNNFSGGLLFVIIRYVLNSISLTRDCYVCLQYNFWKKFLTKSATFSVRMIVWLNDCNERQVIIIKCINP